MMLRHLLLGLLVSLPLAAGCLLWFHYGVQIVLTEGMQFCP
jgi:hypothetical protein